MTTSAPEFRGLWAERDRQHAERRSGGGSDADGSGHGLKPAPGLRAAADTLVGLLDAWDEGAFRDLFGDEANADQMQKRLAWFRQQLGPCGPPEAIAVESHTRTRYAIPCEDGVLEAELQIDEETGSVKRLLSGARDISPEPAVVEAVEGAASLVNEWDDAKFADLASERLHEKIGDDMPEFAAKLRDELGPCELGDVDLGSNTGALYVLDCERGRRTLIVGLNDAGKIRRIRVVDLRRDPA